MGKELIRLRTALRMEAQDEAEIMVYGDICSDGWKWSESDVSAVDFDKHLKAAKDKRRLKLRINSPGGEVFQAVAMRTMLVNAEIPRIDIFIEGLAASAATLLCCIPGARVHIAEGAEYMIHNPWTIGIGEASDFEKLAQRLKTTEESLRGIYQKQTGRDEETIAGWMQDETWFSAKEAVTNGFAHEVMAEEAPIAASVTGDMMRAMKAMYKQVPENIAVMEEEKEEPGEAPDESVSREEAPKAGETSPEYIKDQEKEDKMDIQDITMEQLREGNAELLASIQAEGIRAERERVAEIEALTEPGYEDMADEAKEKGTSPADFLKAVVARKKEKAGDFLAGRRQETEPAASIAAGAAGEGEGEEAAIAANAKEVAEIAKQMRAQAEGGMY